MEGNEKARGNGCSGPRASRHLGTGPCTFDYDRELRPHAWYQAEWTLNAAGITDSVPVNDPTLDKSQQQRVTAWLREASHRDLSFEKPTDSNNNHHDWRGLAATAIGVAASDDKRFRFGVDAHEEAISEIDARGAFPKWSLPQRDGTP